jgi:hypothetical protein
LDGLRGPSNDQPDWYWLIDHDWHTHCITNAADGWTDDVGEPSRLVSLTAE